MSACNLRGFQFLSGEDVVSYTQFQNDLNIDKESGDFFFKIDSKFDTIQNIKILSKLGKHYQVYLSDKNKNIIYALGTSQFEIFPNTSLPYSEPFYNFLKPECGLLVKGVDVNDMLIMKFERSLLSVKLRDIISENCLKDYQVSPKFDDRNGNFSLRPSISLKISY